MPYNAWFSRAYQQLLSPLRQGRAPHAWLISYVPGSGETDLIVQLIAAILCQTHPTIACGKCHSCMLYQAGTHPDYYLLDVEDDRTVIRIEQVRKLIDKIYEHSQQGGAKVIWIKNAMRLSESASNALLKTLEEPAENTYFILSEEQPKRLMPTVRSRCHEFHLPVPDLKESILWLQDQCPGHTEHELATALLLQRQAPLAAKALLHRESWHKRQVFCEALYESVSKGQFWTLLTYLTQGDVFPYIHWFCSLLVDALKAKGRAGKYITNRDQVPLVRMLARHHAEVLHEWYRDWQMSAHQITHIPGLNKPLILANMLAQTEKKVM